MSYCTVQEVREVGSGISPSGVPNAPDDMLRRLITRASRYFDLQCTVKPGYFESAYYPVWASLQIYLVGDIVTPTTTNGHKYRVTTAGTSAATEPVAWGTTAAATVTSGTVVFTENGADVAASDRIFYGDGTTKLRLDPYIAGTLNATIVVPTGYTAPEFIEREGFLIRSSSGVVLDSSYGYYRGALGAGWARGLPITVNALWGWPETPDDVKMAVIEMVVNIYRETDPANMKLTGMEGASLRESLPPRVKAVISEYKFSEAKVIFT